MSTKTGLCRTLISSSGSSFPSPPAMESKVKHLPRILVKPVTCKENPNTFENDTSPL